MKLTMCHLRQLLREEKDPFPSRTTVGDLVDVIVDVNHAGAQRLPDMLKRAVADANSDRLKKELKRAHALAVHAAEDLKGLEALVLMTLQR